MIQDSLKVEQLSNKTKLVMATIGVASAGLLIIVELTLRVLGISYPVFHQYDSIRGKALIPGKEGWYRSEGEAYIKINSSGYRDREFVQTKKDGTYRIAILGDSYMEARQVDLDKMFGRRLEEYLKTCQIDGYTNFETLSFGQGGYSTTDELLTLKHYVWDYSPNMVLTAFFHGNDFVDNYPQMNCQGQPCPHIERPFYYVDKEDLKLDNSFRDLTLTSIKRRLLLAGVQYFRVLEFLNYQIRVYYAWRMKHDPDFAFQETGLSEWVYSPPTNPDHQKAWKLTEGIVRLLHREILSHQAQPFLFLVTNPSQVDPKQQETLKNRLQVQTLDYPEKRIMELGKQLHMPVVPLIYDFQRYAKDHQVYLHGFPNTRMGAGHWNQNGHDLAAKIVAHNICTFLSAS